MNELMLYLLVFGLAICLYLLVRNENVCKLRLKLLHNIPMDDTFDDKICILNNHSYNSMLLCIIPLSKIEKRIVAEMEQYDKERLEPSITTV